MANVMKRIQNLKLKPFLFLSSLLLIIGISILFSDEKAYAHKSISDGNATSGNYNPFDVSKTSWNKRWDIKGSRGALSTSGKKLVYDVYRGTSGKTAKGKFFIEEAKFSGAPKQKYLVFYGWSALQGYHHHYANNQATYILLFNPVTFEEKMYKAQMTSLDASEDMEWGRSLSGNKSIYNPCGEETFNRRSDSCNMYYKYVGFKAWIPLEEVFPETENAKWQVYIVKNVENHVVYDELRLPFDFEKVNINGGEVSLSSDVDNTKLVMNTEGVIRRTEPRGNNSSDQGKYFEKGKTYTKIDSDEEEGTAIWYAVRSPEDGGKKRWTSSPYWNFGGSQAVLKMSVKTKKCPDGSTVPVSKSCKVNVTIQHIDYDTKKTLKTTTEKATVGEKYSFQAEPKGTFKDSKGNPYAPYPDEQKQAGTTPNSNFSIKFYYRVVQSDPTKEDKYKGSDEGSASGEFLWRLEKVSDTSLSRIRLINNPIITGSHFATRNIQYTISSSSGTIYQRSQNPIDIYLINPNYLKNQKIHYTFQYEFTNYYKDNYKCVEKDKKGKNCFKWEFVDRTPIWEKGKTATWEGTLTADHNYEETFAFYPSSVSDVSLTVGRKYTLNGSGMTASQQKETYSVDNSSMSLISQNWIPIDEEVQYSSSFGNRLYFIPEYLYFFPHDIDDNLRNKYKNKTYFNFSNYAIPLRLGNQKYNSLTFNTADNFFVTENEGFLFSVPYNQSSISEIKAQAKQQYEGYMGKTLNDDVINYNIENGSRYYFNIDGTKGEEKPQTWYEHSYVLSKLGLSDIQIQLHKYVKFNKYLLGSPVDDPLIAEEPDSVNYNTNYSKSITLTPEQQEQIRKLANNRTKLIHSFRSTDIKEKMDELKKIISSLSQ